MPTWYAATGALGGQRADSPSRRDYEARGESCEDAPGDTRTSAPAVGCHDGKEPPLPVVASRGLQNVPEAQVWPLRAPLTVLALPSLVGTGVLPLQVSLPPSWLPSTSVSASWIRAPLVVATLLETVML